MLKLLLLAVGAIASQVPLGDAGSAPGAGVGASTPRSVQLDLSPYLNAKATSVNGENDGKGFRNGSTFPSEHLPVNKWSDSGVDFVLPNWIGKHDCVRANKQVIHLPDPTEVRSIHLLGAGEDAGGFLFMETHETLTLTFEDGGKVQAPFEVKHWWSHHWTNKSPIRAPYHFIAEGVRSYNASHLFHIPVAIPPSAAGRTLTSVRLPGPAEKNALKVFAMSYVPVSEQTYTVRWARGTRRWENGHQIVEVLLANPRSVSEHSDPSAWVTDIGVTLHGETFKGFKEQHVNRLMPGDEVLLEFEVEPRSGSSDAFDGAHLQVRYHDHIEEMPVHVDGVRLLHSPDYTEAEIEEHSRPGWYDGAKFGIFIHWGLFSVPAFAAPPQYAEWYDFWLHDGEKPTENHHRATYGAEFNYDDFIPMFTADKYNASEWMDVIAASGAKYFVFTTKHHDGFAMFDTKDTSDRNSLLLGPKRDILKELMTAAKEEHPELKRGTYFSLPEWFNPLYAPHGRLSFPGGPALNPFTREEEPFTGQRDTATDFIEDIQRPQMEILVDEYEVDLLWCDIGLDNHSSAVFSRWYADAARQGREVAINNRCGVGGDFDTPEMTRFATVQPRKWETCASMDPHSFGYNKATKDEEYRSPQDVVHSLIDIVAKGGNFLLNVGPRADGSIPKAQSEPLREAGKWLKLNGRAIYDTTPFEPYPEHNADGVHVEFTRKPEAFYIISLRKPGRTVAITAPLPVLTGDRIVAVTPEGDKTVKWLYEEGTLVLDTRGIEFGDDGIAWVFEVQYANPDAARDEEDDSEPVHDEL